MHHHHRTSGQTTRSGGALLLAGLLGGLLGGEAQAESTLKYFTWAGYDDPAFRGAYTEKYGEGPEFIFFAHPDEAYAKLIAGFEADVAHPCIHDVYKWKESGLLKPIATDKLATWNDLIPALREANGLVLDGQHWLVPWEWGFSSVLYRTDEVTLTEESYRVMIDPAFKGRTAVPDAFDEVYQLAALIAGVETPLALTEADYAKVEEAFRAINANLRFVWNDPATLEQAMATGEVAVAWGWPNSYANLKAEGVPVGYMLKPEEGVVTWLCGYAYLASSTAPEEEVYDFIAALTSPEAGKTLVEAFGYGHANAKALALVAPEKLAELGLDGDPAQFLAEGNFLGAMPEEQRSRLAQLWETIRAGG